MAVGNGVTIVVDAQNKTAQAFGEAAKGAKTVGDAADIAGRHLKDMGAKLDDAQVKARKLAESEERSAAKAHEMAEKLAILRQQLAESGDESGKLSRRIDRLATDTRYAALATDDYRRSANRASAEAREQARAYDRVADNARQAARAVALLGAATVLGPNGGGGKKGSWLSNLLGLPADAATSAGGAASSIGAGFASTPIVGPVAVAAGVVGAAAAAPFVGGAAGGAALLGGAAAGAGAGLAGAWMGDPDKYQSLWNKAIDGIQRRWLDSSSAFGNELEDGLKVVDRTLRDLPVEKVLALSQSFVMPLAAGAGAGITAAADGFADFLDKAQPVVDVVGPKLANLGGDIGDAFRMIGEGSEGGALALGDLVDAMGWAVKAAGLFVMGFEEAYKSIRDFEKANFHFIASVPVLGAVAQGAKEKLFGIASTSHVAGRALDGVGGSAADAAVGVAGLSFALDEYRSKALSMADANIGVAQGWIDLKKELADGAKSLDLTTQAGIDNQQAIVGQIGLLEQQRLQAIETGDGSAAATAKANAEYAASVEKIRAAAIAAGFNKDQVDALITSLGAVPPETKSDVQVTGLSTSLAQGISLGNALNRIDGQTYEANVYTYYHTRGQALNAPQRTGGVGHAATGGSQSGLTQVGEEGPEFARLPTGTMVYPHANTAQMQTMAGWGGGGGTTLLIGSDGSRLGDVLVEVIADSIKARGGRPELLGIKIQGR